MQARVQAPPFVLLFILLAAFVVSAAAPTIATAAGRRPSRLAQQSSPYLLQHADNPVDWYPWGEEAFERARREDRPVFLSVGYSSCHWCHVMERESFEDEQVAAILNEKFISIKVDREERPDLDAIYMGAVLVTTGGGGWPMSVFLTPERKPFHGGTYFPKARFLDLLVKIADSWSERRPELLSAADNMSRAIGELQTTPGAGQALPADADLLDAAVKAYAREFDSTHGGFGGAPKFPPHGAVSLLLRAHRERDDQKALDMAVTTLLAMARGGIYDQVGGGFHRYATDVAWRVPHFEKMLYDNALLAPLYYMAWKQSGRDELRRVADETLRFVERDLGDPGGGFHTALDADTEGGEGTYYTWTLEQMRAVLGADTTLIAEYYGVTGGAGDSRTGRAGAILRVVEGDETFAERHGLKQPEWRARLDAARARLLKARMNRPRPRIDDKVLTAWNGLMISALAVGRRATAGEASLTAGRRAAAFALANLRDPRGEVRVSWRRGRPGGQGFLDDNAFLARGLLDLHGADPDPAWVEAAVAVVKDAGRFADDASGGYFFAARRPDLLVRPMILNDSALPSGNAVMVENLARLSRLTGDLGYLRTASRVIDRAGSSLRTNPASHPYLIQARDTVLVLAQSAPATAQPPAAGGIAASAEAAAAVPATTPGKSPTAPVAPVQGVIVGRGNKERVVESVAFPPPMPARPGAAVAFDLRLDIKSGWHVNSSRPTLEYLIPTQVTSAGSSGPAVESVGYPEGKMVRLAFADDELSVYEGRVTLTPSVRLPGDAAEGASAVTVRLMYQSCSDRACLPPETVEFVVPVTIAGTPLSAEEIAASTPPASQPRGGRGAMPALDRVTGQDQISVLLRTRGLLFVIGITLLGGLALTLTPCVYPMIPVTIGFFSNQAAGAGWGRRVALPALYVLGLALTFSVLGVVAGLSGGLFGSMMQNPIVVSAMALLFVAMALWMFGVYELRLPGWMTQVGSGRTGALGALVMGLTLGLVAAPCIGPFIVTLLAFVGASRSPTMGFLLFFVLAVGMGLPFLVLGAFSGMLSSLPRSGVWLIYAKKVMGVGLLAVALYFLQPFLSDRVLGAGAIVLALAAGLYLAILERTRVKASWWMPLRLTTGVLVVLIGFYLALPLVRAREEAPWQPFSQEAFDAAKASGRPILIDFFAVWCAPCRELDRHTYSDEKVLAELRRFTLLKADLTNEESPLVQTLREQYEVYGVPTVVFIDAAGNDLKDLRLTGFEPPEPFLERLGKVR